MCPCLLYGICVWGSSGTGNVDRLKMLQKSTSVLSPNHEDSELFFIRNRILGCVKMFVFRVSLKFHKYFHSTVNPEKKTFY